MMISSAGKDVKSLELSYIANGMQNIKLNIYSLYNLAIPLGYGGKLVYLFGKCPYVMKLNVDKSYDPGIPS